MSGFKLSSLLSNERGFSLTEIMVGGGILAGVALASAQMFKDQKAAQRKIDNEQKLTIYHQGLSKNMAKAANCNATLQIFNGAGGVTTNAVIPRLAKCTSNCDDKGGDLDHKASDVVAGDLLKPGDFVDGTRAWKLLDVRVKAGRSTNGPVILKVNYQMNPDLVDGRTDKIVSKDIVLSARFDGSQFMECVDAQESNINNLQSDFCKTLNYGNVDSTGTSGQLARWDEATQRCIVGTDKDCKDQGMFIDGIDSNGMVKCRKLSNKETADTFQSTSSSNACADGARATMQFNSTTKRFEIVCP